MTHRISLGTAVGTLTIDGDEDAVTYLGLPGSTLPPGPAPTASTAPGLPGPLADAARQLEEYFAGRRQRFDLPLALDGTPFQREVWLALADIPYGETISYAELAQMVGRPQAFRAVGQANGKNPIPIVLPCHRVVASGGGIGGYGGGLTLKRELLALEGITPGD